MDLTLTRCILVNFTTIIPDGSPERQAVNELIKLRNKTYGHATEGKISDNEYKIYKADIEKFIMVLAIAQGRESEFRQKLKDAAVRPLDETILRMYQTKLMENDKSCQEMLQTLQKIASAVVVKPLPEYLTKDLEDIKTLEGCDAKLELWTTDRDVNVEWFKDDKRIEMSDKYVVKIFCQMHSLVITNTDCTDRGIYTAKILGSERKAKLDIEEYFTKNMKTIYEYTEGHCAELSCAVQEDNVTAHWEKESVGVQQGDKYKITDESKNHKLSITHVNLQDAGRYPVKINDRMRSTSLTIKEYYTKSLDSQTCVEGESVQFECEVLEENQTALWYKDGTEVSTSDKYKVESQGKLHRLVVNTTKLGDKGQYSVKIKNCVRQSELTVQEYFTKSLDTKTCVEGESVQFECEVLEESQTALWYKDGTEVSTSDKYEVKRQGKLHRLVVNTTKLDDKGQYSVQIKNCVRQSELTVQEYFTKSLDTKTCVEGESVQFECEVLEESQTALWYKDGTEVSTSDKYEVKRQGKLHRLVVNTTKLDDKGQYSVQIKNCVRQSELTVQEIPAAIRQLSKEDKGLYLEIIKSATETRYYIRIVIIGENGVGKTCLLRRLLGESIEHVESTDGIDIVHRCKIRLHDGQWIIDKGTDKRKDLMTRIKRILNAKKIDINKEQQNYSQSTITEPSQDNHNLPGTIKEDEENKLKRKNRDDQTDTDEPSTPTTSKLKKKYKDDEIHVDINEPSTQSTGDNRQGNSDASSLPKDEFVRFSSQSNQLSITDEPKLEKVLTDTILNELSMFINDIEKYEIPNEVLVDCGFWDFAGQRHYYRTHPIFLNPNAVHLLVADIMKDIKRINTEDGYDKIGEYLDFWFDSIHSCGATVATEDSTGDYLNPPVIVVCTGIDKCKDKFEERKKEFRKHLTSLLHNEDKQKHLRRICCISNTEPSQKDFDHLRQSIFEFGKNIETYEERLPLKWIHLEQALDILCEAGVNILSWPDIAGLASKCLIEDENEVSLFLKYHHKIGSIIYFESLKQHIILNQKWLSDAFRCFVSDKYDSDLKLTKDWKTLEYTGELKPSLITKLFQKEPKGEFYKHESHLLKIMEMFGIIVKIETCTDDGQRVWTYYMPCMISEQTSIKQIYDVFCVKRESCTPTPWLCIQFDFMPFDFFNMIFCQYSRKYSVCTEALSGRLALYHGMGVFFLDKSESRKFILCFSKNTIAMQIWQWKKLEQRKCKSMLEELISVIHNVKDKYEPRRLSYSVKTKCANGNIHIIAGRKSYKELKDLGDEEYFCEEHHEIHDTRDFFQTWFEEYSEKGIIERFSGMCHVCKNKPCVYWCCECEKSMCEDCTNHRRELNINDNPYYDAHYLQHVQDMYSLDSIFQIYGNDIIDVKVLYDGLLVIACDDDQLVTCHITGQEQQKIPLPDRPHCIAVVDNNTVAVTLYYTVMSLLAPHSPLVIVDVRKRQVIQHIDVNTYCVGIMYRDNQLFVGCGDNTIKLMNMSGNVMYTIPVSIKCDYICGSEAGQIYYTDTCNNRLFCIDTVGNTLFTFTDPNMEEPLGITTDDEGHVLVICEKSYNVVRISPDGKQCQVIIQKLPFVDTWSHMYCICYSSLSKSVVIGIGEYIFVYKKV